MSNRPKWFSTTKANVAVTMNY